jgi:molybdopterin synthase catalytic subunit
MIQIKVLFFASCRDHAGVAQMEMELSCEPTIQELMDRLISVHPRLAGLAGSLQVAVNEEYQPRCTRLCDGDEVALIPPVSGGGGGDVFRVVTEGIRADELHDLVRTAGDGAVATFSGVVRDHSGEVKTSYLEYEAYPSMAERVMADLAEETRRRWPVGRIGILHRVGRLEIGEIAVLISVASGHRREAFEACHHLVDRLKQVVPIWKKEVGPTGEYWVEGPQGEEAEAR